MRVLLVGSGAREHAIAWKLRQSPKLSELLVTPGNAGTAQIANNLPVNANDIDGIVRLAKDERIDLVMVGPEEPLTLGLVDRLIVEGIYAFGPSCEAAQLEGSKSFAKDLMSAAGVPTAPYRVFDGPSEAVDYVKSVGGPVVVKADGLAAGKGVFVTSSTEQALNAIDEIMVRRAFGDAGSKIVIEQRLYGRETSAMAFTDGVTVASMPFSCDHKPVFDNDEGPNTGGMGAYSPPAFVDADLATQIHSTVTQATVKAMMGANNPYRGILYPGLMMSNSGPMVLEYNCRFGDPETQVLLPRLKTDLLEILVAVTANKLHEISVEWSDDVAVGVVLASGGYPGEYRTGLPIQGLDAVDSDVMVFHAGTKLVDGRVVTSGGRVATVVATAPTIADARSKAYANVERINFDGMHYRTDIALREISLATTQ